MDLLTKFKSDFYAKWPRNYLVWNDLKLFRAMVYKLRKAIENSDSRYASRLEMWNVIFGKFSQN